MFQFIGAVLVWGTMMYGGSGVTVKVSPSQIQAGTYQHMQFQFTLGQTGIGVGGAVRIELPVAYLETEPYYWDRPQIDLPEGRGYIKATSSRGAKFRIRVSGPHGGVVECQVESGSVKSGEKIQLDYWGVVQSLTSGYAVRAEWRKDQQAQWQTIAHLPEVTILPQSAVTMVVVIPSDIQSDKDVDIAVVLLDKFGNRASGYRGAVSLTSTSSQTGLPESYQFTGQDSGVHVFKGVKFKSQGFQRVMSTDKHLVGKSNFAWVSESPSTVYRCFGDTHFHTGSGADNQQFGVSGGGDHRGNFTTEVEAYQFARDVVRLDFASAAEHDAATLDSETWKKCEAIAEAFNAPDEFTTFFAYEWTRGPQEHHVVVYRDPGNVVFDSRHFSTLPALWHALDKQGTPALTIPHVMWPIPGDSLWKDLNNSYRRIGEIYSLWNNRFLLQPGDDPQRFELGPGDQWSYQYAWSHGSKIGVIGSSDNHTGRPGANNYTVNTPHPAGLAVVLAKGNNRRDIWDAFERRHTYATTGTRIYLDFSADGHSMGDEYSANRPPTFQVKVGGSNKIQDVELVKYDAKGYRTIHADHPNSETSVFQFTDSQFDENSFYYVRVTQVDEHRHGAWAYTTSEMAWSSPIWINKVH
jgi:hypothetical protein